MQASGAGGQTIPDAGPMVSPQKRTLPYPADPRNQTETGTDLISVRKSFFILKVIHCVCVIVWQFQS